MAHALEAIGLLLAILDFSGWSRKLEEIIDSRRERYRHWLRSQRILSSSDKFASRVWGWKEGLVPIGWIIFAVGLAIVAIDKILGLDVLDFLGELVVVVSILIIIILLVWVFFGPLFIIFLSRVIFAVVWIPWAILHTINKPRAGTVGTIGLILAMVGFAVNFLG